MIWKSRDVTNHSWDEYDLRRPTPEMGEEPHILPEAVARPQTSPVGWNTLVATAIHWSDEFGPIVISAAALVVLGGLVFWASVPASVGHEGVLHVGSDPQGLEVQINGELRGRTPVERTAADSPQSSVPLVRTTPPNAVVETSQRAPLDRVTLPSVPSGGAQAEAMERAGVRSTASNDDFAVTTEQAEGPASAGSVTELVVTTQPVYV